MRRTSNRLRRWASLSALASAALAASAGSGEAAIIYHSAHGVGPGASLPLPGGNHISALGLLTNALALSVSGTVFGVGPKGRTKTSARLFGTTHGRSGLVAVAGVSFRRAAGNGTFRPIVFARKGQTFNQVGSGVGSASLGHFRYKQTRDVAGVAYFYGPRLHRFPPWSRRGYRSFGSTFRRMVRVATSVNTQHGTGFVDFARFSTATIYSLVGYGKEYALFRFDVGSQIDYGWLELSLGGSPGSAPFVRLIGYAYDTDGQPIPAGALPEPKHLPLALGALALGAVGVREWRKKRRTST